MFELYSSEWTNSIIKNIEIGVWFIWEVSLEWKSSSNLTRWMCLEI